jgi:hypothetical protein
VPDDVKQDFVGVTLMNVGEPNGALMHDIAWTFLHLPQDARGLFGRQLSRLLHQWQTRVPAKKLSKAERAEAKAAAAETRKAATG